MIEALRTCLTRFGELTATPAAFGIFLAYVCYGQSGDEFGRCDFFSGPADCCLGLDG
jgi:hypothetical protein